MELNAPSVDCPYCKGTGGRVRELKIMFNGHETRNPVKAFLHCGCLSAELAALHSALKEGDVLKDWPWSELKDLKVPKTENGPEPARFGCPLMNFSVQSTDLSKTPKDSPLLAKAVEPVVEELKPEPKKRRGRSKVKK